MVINLITATTFGWLSEIFMVFFGIIEKASPQRECRIISMCEWSFIILGSQFLFCVGFSISETSCRHTGIPDHSVRIQPKRLEIFMPPKIVKRILIILTALFNIFFIPFIELFPYNLLFICQIGFENELHHAVGNGLHAYICPVRITPRLTYVTIKRIGKIKIYSHFLVFWVFRQPVIIHCRGYIFKPCIGLPGKILPYIIATTIKPLVILHLTGRHNR